MDNTYIYIIISIVALIIGYIIYKRLEKFYTFPEELMCVDINGNLINCDFNSWYSVWNNSYPTAWWGNAKYSNHAPNNRRYYGHGNQMVAPFTSHGTASYHGHR
jgi:hypothetical protein